MSERSPIPDHAWLQATNISKRFGGVQALSSIDVDIREGEVLGLVGANGAGKSTFIRLLAGLISPDSGTITLDGNRTEIHNPSEASELGFSFIHQELNLVPRFSSVENMTLGRPKPRRMGLIDWSTVRGEVEDVAARLGAEFDLDIPVEDLSVADRWLVSIGRALIGEARLIAMDEPTASLSAEESERLFQIVRDLSSHGIAILYVSHRLEEILQLCHRVTVFKDGRKVITRAAADLDKRQLVEAIVGAEFVDQEIVPATPRQGSVVLDVNNVRSGNMVRGVSFQLHEGEVLGLAGLVGAGRTELARLIFGADRLDGGEIRLDGGALRLRTPADATRAGICLVPEERRSQGIVIDRSISFNINLPSFRALRWAKSLPLLNMGEARLQATKVADRLQIKMSHVDAPVRELSGGNQQKVVIGKWLGRKPRVLILDEPSRGVDVGARAEIHHIVRETAEAGAGAIVISSEIEELVGLCDRVLVMAEGKIVGSLVGEGITKEAMVSLSYVHAAEQDEEIALGLRTRTTVTWAVVIADIQNPFFSSVVRGIEDVAREAGYSVVLRNSDEDVGKEAEQFDSLASARTAGVILSPASVSDTRIEALLDQGIPVVAIDRRMESALVDTVLVDNVEGGRQATAHLVSLGRRRIACITGSLSTTTGAERLAGYRAALADAGVSLDKELVRVSDFKEAGGYQAASELLALADPPDALFVANNLMTLGAFEALRDRGIAIPEQVALVGFDDEPWMAFATPSVTVVAQPTYELGVAAAKRLLDRVSGSVEEAQEMVLKPELRVRQSG
jgi:ribose transport system ATP-binding protein